MRPTAPWWPLATGLGPAELDDRVDDPISGTLGFWTADGRLMRTDGVSTTVIATLQTLGFQRIPHMYLLDGGLIELLSTDWRREVILHPDGAVFARASAPAHRFNGFGDQTASPGGSMVAYALTSVFGGARVYVLRQGDRHGELVYRTRQGVAECDLPLAWNGRWLLFTPHGADPVAIDMDGGSGPIELPDLSQWLPWGTGTVSWMVPG